MDYLCKFLYKSEDFFEDKLKKNGKYSSILLNNNTLHIFLEKILASKWWVKKNGADSVTYEIKKFKDKRLIALSLPEKNYIYFKKNELNKIIVLHEITHILNKNSKIDHNIDFIITYLESIYLFINKQSGLLMESIIKNNINDECLSSYISKPLVNYHTAYRKTKKSRL